MATATRRARARGPLPIAECEGLLVEPGPAGVAPARARAIAARIARELPGRWRARPLGRRVATLLLERLDRTPSLAEGWTLARRLRARPDVLDAEPALRLPGLEPEPALRRSVIGDLVPRSLGAGRPLPGTVAPDWAIRLARFERAWAMFASRPGRRSAPGAGVAVAHPDTGYTRHPAIWTAPDGGRLRAAAGWDFVGDDRDARDPLDGMSAGHGTATASVLMSDGRAGGAEHAVAGAAPGAVLVPLRVSDSVVHLVSYANVIAALHAATDGGAHVVSMSLGGPLPSRALQRALRRAEERGVLMVAAAGNMWPWVVYPGRYDEVLCLAACDIERRPWRRSSSGPEVDLAGPGVSVWHATASSRRFGLVRGDGTSFATALAAGAAALWLSWHGRRALLARFGPAGIGRVFRALARESSVAPAGWRRDRHGGGILDAARLLEAALPATVQRRAPGARGGGPGRIVEGHPAATIAPEPLLSALAATVPGLGVAGSRRALAALFGVATRGLERELEPFADELRFHATFNPAFRAAMGATAGARAGGVTGRAATARVARARGSLRTDARLAREASPELLARLAR